MNHLIKSASILLLFTTLTSCGNNKTEKLIKDLQGDWISKTHEVHFFSIKDSLISGWQNDYNFQPYTIQNDTLFSPDPFFRLPIYKITEKYFWWEGTPPQKDYPLCYKSSIHHNELLELKSLEVRFNNYWYRGLFDWALHLKENGDCYMTIRAQRVHRHIKNPLPYLKGNYFKLFTKKEYDFIENKFRNIPINLVKKEYISEYFDYHDNKSIYFECTYGIKNVDGERTIGFTVKGSDCVPRYLGIFLNYLNNIHTFINFEETTKTHEFKFYDSKYLNWNR